MSTPDESVVIMQQPRNSEETTKAFTEAYTTWIQTARKVKMALKKFCSENDLYELKQMIQDTCNIMSECYESIQHSYTARSNTVKKMDACIIITTEICDLVDKYLEAMVERRFETEDEDKTPVGEKEMVGESVKESTPTHNPTDQESVGESAKEPTPTDNPNGQENQSSVNNLQVREKPTPSDSDVVMVLELDLNVKNNVQVKDSLQQSKEQESDSGISVELDMSSGFVSRSALIAKRKLKRRKKPVKGKTEPPKDLCPWRSGTIEGSYSTPSPAFPPAKMRNITTVPPVPFEATGPGPPQSQEDLKPSLSNKPLGPVKNRSISNVQTLPNPAVKKDAVDDPYKPDMNILKSAVNAAKRSVALARRKSP